MRSLGDVFGPPRLTIGLSAISVCGVRAIADEEAQAEGVSGGIRVHLEGVAGSASDCFLQYARTERNDLFMCRREVVDPEVEVNLLRRPVRPLRFAMVR